MFRIIGAHHRMFPSNQTPITVTASVTDRGKDRLPIGLKQLDVGGGRGGWMVVGVILKTDVGLECPPHGKADSTYTSIW